MSHPMPERRNPAFLSERLAQRFRLEQPPLIGNFLSSLTFPTVAGFPRAPSEAGGQPGGADDARESLVG